jgi:hypothetical protein
MAVIIHPPKAPPAVDQKKWQSAKNKLPENLRPMMERLRSDWMAAQKEHIPTFAGGPNADILAALVRWGWHKWP